MSQNSGRLPGGDWRVSPWQVTTADEARDVKGLKMIVPDAEANAMRTAAGKPHGTCKHFLLREGQEIVKDLNFFRELLHGSLSDTAYLPEWLSKETGYGICALIGSETLIHALHPGTCTLEQAKAWGKAEGLEAWQRGEGKIVACPCWQEATAQAGKGSRRR